MSEWVIEVEGLCKSYGPTEVLKGLDLSVERGQIYGFLGRNGAGKSTCIRILVGILVIDKGQVRLFGEPMGTGNISLRSRIGYVAQEQNFYPWMTPRALGDFVRGFYPNWVDQLYDSLLSSLELPRDRKVGAFSGGMKAKQALALALSHRPPLLILDEPTAGLDPVARREFFRIVREETKEHGTTILFSSHLITEVERVSNQLGIIDGGVTHYQGSVTELALRVKSVRGLPPEWVAPPEMQVLRKDDEETVFFFDSSEQLPHLLGEHPEAYESPLTLEDIFVELVTRSKVS